MNILVKSSLLIIRTAPNIVYNACRLLLLKLSVQRLSFAPSNVNTISKKGSPVLPCYSANTHFPGLRVCYRPVIKTKDSPDTSTIR